MGASQSDLSNPKFGYDLVVAVTQASIDVTMEQFLAGVASPEVIACYVYNASNDLVPIDYATLKGNAKGSDPFAVSPQADPKTDPDLINLAAANFAGAFKARIGLPDMPLASIPAIATLGSGTNAPVLFNLLCAEFQIAGFEYGPRGSVTWINAQQPVGQGPPWYFSANVSLNAKPIDPNSPVPPAVQQRINQLEQSFGPGAFSVQQLFLELDTAILEATPSIVGIPVGWPVWNLITSVFLGAYFKQMQQSGQPVLGYTFGMAHPQPSTMQLGAISHECCALMDNGQPIVNPTPAQQSATSFVYLGTTSTTPPTPVPFPWNWIELNEVANFSGVQAVRRAVFLSYVAGLLNEHIGRLCQNTTVSLSHDGDEYHIRYYSEESPSPASFQLLTSIPAPAQDGYTEALSIGFSRKSHDDSEAADHLSSIHGDFNYTLTGSVGVAGKQLRIQLNAVASMGFDHHEVGIKYDDLPLNGYYNKTLTTIYMLGVDQNGHLAVDATNTVVDNSASWDFSPGGILGLFGLESKLKDGLQALELSLAAMLDSGFTEYVDRVTDEINGYQGWIFPGVDAFVFKNVAFSEGQDLTTQVTYANPGLRQSLSSVSEALS